MLEETLKKIKLDLEVLSATLNDKDKDKNSENLGCEQCLYWISEQKKRLLDIKNNVKLDDVLSGVLATHLDKLIKLVKENSDKGLEQINVCMKDVTYFLDTLKSREEDEKVVVSDDSKNNLSNENTLDNENILDNEMLALVNNQDELEEVKIIEGNKMTIELINFEDLINNLQKIQWAYLEIEKKNFLEEDKDTKVLLECYEEVNNNYYDLLSNLPALKEKISYIAYQEIEKNMDDNLTNFRNNLKNIYKSILNNNRMYLLPDTLSDYHLDIRKEYYVDILKDKRVEKHIRDIKLRENCLSNFLLFLDELDYLIEDCKKLNNINLFDEKITDDKDKLNQPIDDPIQRLNALIENNYDYLSSDLNKEDKKGERIDYSSWFMETKESLNNEIEKDKIDESVDYSSWFDDIKKAEETVNNEEYEAYNNDALTWNKAKNIQERRVKLNILSGRLNQFGKPIGKRKKEQPKLKKFGASTYLKSLLRVKMLKMLKESPYDNSYTLPAQIESHKKK